MAVTPRLSLPQPTGSDLISGGDDAINTGFDTLDNAAMYIDDVFASRPAAGSTTAGTLFYATDTGATYLCNGSAWIELSSGAAVPIGGSVEYAGAGDPDDTRWLLEDGRAISRATYAVYAAQQLAAGYPHGAGNGTTTVNIPDSRGRATVGPDDMGTAAGAAGRMASNKVLGAVGGAETKTLAEANLPVHTHPVGTLATASTGAHDHAFGTLAVAGDGAHVHAVGSLVNSTTGLTTGTESADHSHSGSTGGRSAAHTHDPVIASGFLTGNGTTAALGSGGTARYIASQVESVTFTESADHSHAFTTGGRSAAHTHSISAHGHTISGSVASATHTHTISGSVASNGDHTHTITGASGSTGSGTAYNNMVPYVVKNKIIRVL